jgi:hypothetical protein
MFLNRYFFSFSFLVHLQWNNCSLFQETCFKVVCAKTGNFFYGFCSKSFSACFRPWEHYVSKKQKFKKKVELYISILAKNLFYDIFPVLVYISEKTSLKVLNIWNITSTNLSVFFPSRVCLFSLRMNANLAAKINEIRRHFWEVFFSFQTIIEFLKLRKNKIIKLFWTFFLNFILFKNFHL